MHAVRQKLRPKHQVLILKCYPRTIKGAVDVKPNSSELSYLLYYATTRRSKVQKVGAFLEKKTASDVWRARIGNVQITLQIVAALIEKAPRDLPLYAPYVLKILGLILNSRDITMVESSIPTFEAFCENHDGASISADHDYLHQYDEIIQSYASFCSPKSLPIKPTPSPPVAVRWRNVGLRAIKSVASTDALASVVGRQLDIIVPALLENLWANDESFLATLDHRMQLEEKTDTEKLLRRRTSIATVRTGETAPDTNPAVLSGSTADADKLAEEDIGVLAIQCLKQIFMVNNRAQVYGATRTILKFVSDKAKQNENVINIDSTTGKDHGWATRIFEMITRWTPVQDRYAILVTAMDHLVRSPLTEDNLKQQLILATIVDSLLSSDINLIGLSVMDVLLGLIQHALRTLQLGGAPHFQQAIGTSSSPPASSKEAEAVATPSGNRKLLLDRLQRCIGDLATHVYYADQISDMVSAIVLRLKPPSVPATQTPPQSSDNPTTPTTPLSTAPETPDDSTTDGFFSFTTAKIMALESIKSILLVASHRKGKDMVGGGLGRNRVPIRVWEGTQWLLRDPDGRVRKAYVDVLLTWLDTEVTKADLRVWDDSPKPLTRSHRSDSSNSLAKRASSAAPREKKAHKSMFLQLLHLAVYENALEFVNSESDIVLLHLLLAALVDRLGVNAVKNGLPMIFCLQEAILEVETPLAKVRIGSLCHGYFWTLSEVFEFDSSPIGTILHAEIIRRRDKQLWVDKVRHPPVPLRQIGIPGEDAKPEGLPVKEVETEALLPFDDRFQMVTLISLSYTDSISSSTAGSPPASPSRGIGQLTLEDDEPTMEDYKMPEAVKDEMMSEWTKESIIAIVQERSKTVSLNGSRSGTNATGNHRNFLAVNGNGHGGTLSGAQSPTGIHHHTHRSRPNSAYGHTSQVGSLPKIRKGTGNSPSPASESSRNSVTRVDQLKKVLSGQQSLPVSRSGLMHSDTSSDSMVSYDFTASEVSFNPAVAAQGGAPIMERSVSQRVSRERSRSKSRERPVSMPADHSNPLSSNPVLINESGPEDDADDVPPVPPLPSSFANEGSTVSSPADSTLRKGRSVKRAGTKSRGGHSSQSPTAWHEQQSGGPSIDLENLLKGIEAGGGEMGEGRHIVKPPY